MICPKCKEELQFPFMICPNCKWKAKGQTVTKHAQFAEIFISEHPDDADQLKMVLDMVMKDKASEYDGKAYQSKVRKELREKIRVWHILFCFLVSTLWIFFALAYYFDNSVIQIFDNDSCGGLIVALMISFGCSVALPVLIILKLISIKK